MLLRWEELTSGQIAALDRARTVVFLPIGPLEEHGPHLPTGTDIIEAVEVVRRVAAAVAEVRPELSLVTLPPVPVAVDAITAIGSLWTRPSAVHDLVVDIGASLARQGFRHVVVLNHHGSPRHLVCLEQAARRVSRRFGVRMVSPSANLVYRLYFRGELSRLERFVSAADAENLPSLTRDCHAGAFETSEILAGRPDLVRPEYRSLEPFELPLHQFNPRTLMRLPGSRGYMGRPAVASAELGESYYRFLAEEGRALILDLVDGRPITDRVHSPLVWVPWFRVRFWEHLGWIVLAAAIALAFVLK
jgi:creatinine amidohydrolase